MSLTTVGSLGGTGGGSGGISGPIGITGVVSVTFGLVGVTFAQGVTVFQGTIPWSVTGPIQVFEPMGTPLLSDAIGVTYPSVTSEVFLFFDGGLAGTLLQTTTVTYTDSTKANLLSVVVT